MAQPPETGPKGKKVAVVVAHPDDETLWSGGLLLSHPEWSVFVAALCRRSDPDRAPRFRQALNALGAQGSIADLDDDPGQTPLDLRAVRDTIEQLVPEQMFDLIITHSPQGEYTRHRRHEETSCAVWALWNAGRLRSGALWTFAYEDDGGAELPRPKAGAAVIFSLSQAIWERKYRLITEEYGFSPQSWEARTTPREEAFQRFEKPELAAPWFGGIQRP